MGKVSTKLYATPSEADREVSREATPIATPITKPPPYKIALPRYSGRPKKFHIFKERFQDLMKQHDSYYSDADKLNILADAMVDAEARKMVLSCYTSRYTEAMDELEANYGRKAVIYPLLMEEMLKREKIDYTAEGMRSAIARTKTILDEMEQIEGKDMELFAVALAVRDFDSETKTEWSKHLKEADELPLDTFLEFVKPLS